VITDNQLNIGLNYHIEIMYSLIPQILLLIGFGLILWLVIKNLPKIKDEEEIDEKKVISQRFEERSQKLSKKIPIEKIDAKVNSFLEKFLRRSRVILMKVDTYLQRHLEALKNHAKPKSIFKAGENLATQVKIEEEDLEIKDLEKEIDLELKEEIKEEIDLIAGVDKVTDELLGEEDGQIIEGDDEVEVLVVGAEEMIKKLDLEPEGEIIEEKSNRKKKKKI
jgi:hypothetical protein